METQFYIVFSLKTLRGHEPFAKYFIGNSREHARTIFGKLQGTDHADEANLLHLDFMEVQDGLPVNLNVLTCSLNQMAENCKIITKELFKLVNLEIKGGSSIP